MGLNIIGSYVQVDHTHNRLLITGRHANPSITHIPNTSSPSLIVYSTFQRLKTPASQKHTKGDNCHLLYALKGKNGLRTTFGDIKLLMINFDPIIEDMIQNTGKYDAVIAMPSSHKISNIYAKRLARKYQCTMLDNVFNKITILEAQTMLQNTNLSSPDKKSLNSKLKKQLNSGKIYFSLKDIPTKFREHFKPIILSSQARQILSGYQKILLADDLLSTGTTLVEGKRLILDIKPTAIINASCLFSAV